ncbi:hypothetical protein [Deinococcus ficus]|uniref:Uncharacterized protein n=1 Tax=Deinococcus ficus TaxID=317577 RepID=A0A221T312_9DEIO|nr:hypothetical protein [Deinococcus ficus]ASN83294.1 hypothetical protein DFI_19035 [Deinococcus ficus]
MNHIKKVLPVLVVVSIMAAFGNAGAIGDVDAGLSKATTAVCDTIKGLQESMFVRMIAMVMFIAGIGMMWLKMRGGMALSLTGFLGYFIIMQSMKIAKSFGLVPDTGCTV